MTPASAASASASLRPTLIAEPSPEGAPPRGRILLVEAQAIVGLDLQRALREAGWRVIGPAVSPADVRALTARGRIDGAVVDLDGLDEAAAAIADLLDEAGVPVVFLAASRERIPVRYRNRTALAKPCAASEVVAALDRIVATDDDIVYPVTPTPLPWPRVLPQL